MISVLYKRYALVFFLLWMLAALCACQWGGLL